MADLTKFYAGGFPAMAMIPAGTDLADPVGAFIDAAIADGVLIDPDRFVADGSINRCAHKTSKRGELDAWASLHLDGPVPVGVYGSWKEPQFEQKWVASIGRMLTFQESAAQNQWLEALKKKREEAKRQMQEEAAARADEEVSSLADASDDHPYLVRKRVKAHGVKINRAGALVIPICTADGEIQTYQTISAAGDKRYLRGGKKEGGFFEIRGDRKRIFIAEGFATGATVNEATGSTVFVAFDTQGLHSVGKAVRSLFPAAKIYFAADNDQFTTGNPGLSKAHAAAKTIMAEVVHPVFPSDTLDNKPTDFNDLAALCGISDVLAQINSVVSQAPAMAFPFTRADNLELKAVEWVIDDYIEADSLIQIFGDPGCGKSFVAIDMACCIGTGTPWHGHETTKGSVFYIAGEGHNGLARRFCAWELGKDVSLAGAPIYKSHRAAMLYDATEAAMVGESVRQLVEECGVHPKAIVIDTLARNMGGDENSTQDMNSFIAHIDTYLRHKYKCAVIVVHHSGAADKERSRGSTALRGAIDAEYRVAIDPVSSMVQMESKKMKEASLPPPKSFNLAQVNLPIINKHGEHEKGAFLSAVDISGLMNKVRERGEFLGKNQQQVLTALVELEYRRTKEDRKELITADEWRESCAAAGIKRNRFSEAKATLVAKNKVVEGIDGTVRSRASDE